MGSKLPHGRRRPHRYRHEDDKWVLYTKDGDRVLGRHETKEKAEAQERAIKAHGG